MVMTKAGGKRSNAGRKPIQDKRQTYTMRLTPTTIEKIKYLKSNTDFKVGESFEKFIDNFYDEVQRFIVPNK